MPKTQIQNQQIKEERIESIITVAAQVFAVHHYGSITIDDITSQANCSHGLFYHYFSSIDELFHQTIETAIKEIKPIVEEVDLATPPYFVKLEKIIESFIQILKGSNESKVSYLYLLLNMRLRVNEVPPPPDEVKNMNRKPINIIIGELIENAQKEGTAKQGDVKEYTISLIALLKGLSYNRLYVGADKFICPSAQTILNLIRS